VFARPGCCFFVGHAEGRQFLAKTACCALADVRERAAGGRQRGDEIADLLSAATVWDGSTDRGFVTRGTDRCGGVIAAGSFVLVIIHNAVRRIVVDG
jgi:hypothetical protein